MADKAKDTLGNTDPGSEEEFLAPLPEGEDLIANVNSSEDLTGEDLLIGDDDDDGFRDQVNQKWVKSYSPEHRSVYYFNEITEETTWHLPEGVEVSREDEWATNTWDSSAEHGGSEETESEKDKQATLDDVAFNADLYIYNQVGMAY